MAKVVFVGDAPSLSQPMSDGSYRVFNAMLRSAGLEPGDYTVRNVFSKPYPSDGLGAWTVPTKDAKEEDKALPPIGAYGYLRAEHHHELQRLEQELAEDGPTVIVPLGGTALWAFTGSSGVASVRGTVMASTRVSAGTKLLPTYHPSFVMAQWKYFSVVSADLIRAVRQAELGPEIVLPRRELWLDVTLQDMYGWTDRLKASDLLSVDIETGWGQITSIGFAPDQYSAIVVPFVDKRQPDKSYWRTVLEEKQAWAWVQEIMQSPVPKLGQNFGGYDAYWFIERMGIEPRNFRHDTRLMHHVLYPELEKSLEFMGASYTSQGAWKSWARHGEKRDD
jgi:uracil-DNA glycosylase